jgi:hypothetical protein
MLPIEWQHKTATVKYLHMRVWFIPYRLRNSYFIEIFNCLHPISTYPIHVHVTDTVAISSWSLEFDVYFICR